MPRHENAPAEIPSALAPAFAWPARWRMLASVLLLLHLAAVVVAPLSNPPPASMLSQIVAGWFEPYLAGADLNHGYRFFAPDPGASSLVRYELIMPDGSRETHQFPSVDDHWPRLIYHRHFMIAETINSINREILSLSALLEIELPPQAEAQRRAQGEGARRLLAELLEGVARDLLIESGAERVELTLVTHNIADPELVAYEGVTIDDARWYDTTPLGSLSVGESWTWSEEPHELPERLSP